MRNVWERASSDEVPANTVVAAADERSTLAKARSASSIPRAIALNAAASLRAGIHGAGSAITSPRSSGIRNSCWMSAV
jgi:hypothetical protein